MKLTQMVERVINDLNLIKRYALVNNLCKCLYNAVMKHTLGTLGVVI